MKIKCREIHCQYIMSYIAYCNMQIVHAHTHTHTHACIHAYTHACCIGVLAHTCTYWYTAQRIEQLEATGRLTHKSRFRKWHPTTITEMKGFLSIVLNMGLIELPQIEDYWKTSWVSEVPFFSRVDRFELIFWLLHVSHSKSRGREKDR